MFNLASILYSFISTTIAGIFFVISLSIGYDTLIPLLIAAAAGFAVALPITYFITKELLDQE